MFDIVYWVGYAGPLLAFGWLAAPLVEQHGWRSTIATLLVAALVGAYVLGVGGGLHQEAFGGRFNLAGTVDAFIALSFLQLPTAAAVHVSRRRHVSTRVQRRWGAGVAVTVALLAALPFGITVGCMVSAECL